MHPPKEARVKLTCDCGNKRQVPFAEIYGERTCPACGEVSGFNDQENQAIEAAFGEALNAAMKRRDAGDPMPIAEAPVKSKGSDQQA